MPLKLNSTGGGSVTLDTPSTASAYTLTVPAITGTAVVTGSTATVSQSMLAANVAGNGPAFRAYASGAQAISANTWTKIQFNNELFDTNSNFDPTTNYRFTATIAGYYQINASVGVNSGSNGQVISISIYKNGTQDSVEQHDMSTGNYQFSSISNLIYLNATDYVEAYVYTGYSCNVLNSSTNCFLSGSFVRTA